METSGGLWAGSGKSPKTQKQGGTFLSGPSIHPCLAYHQPQGRMAAGRGGGTLVPEAAHSLNQCSSRWRYTDTEDKSFP